RGRGEPARGSPDSARRRSIRSGSRPRCSVAHPRRRSVGNCMNPNRRQLVIPLVLIVGTAALLAVGGGLFLRSRSRVNKVALAASPKGVTVVEAKAAAFRPRRRYVGTV